MTSAEVVAETSAFDEPDADACRAAFLHDHPDEADAIRATEEQRRLKKQSAQDDLFDADDGEAEVPAEDLAQ